MSSGHRLFPSANAVQKNEHNTVVAVSVIDDCTPTAQKNGNLDWLTNKSFRSDNAIAIAKQHLRTEDSERHRQRLRITTPHPTTSESSDSSSDSSSSSSDSSRSRHSYSKRSREHRHKRGYRAESIDRYRRKSTTSESSDSSSSSSGSSRSRRSYSKRSRKHRHRRDDRAESSDRYRRKRTTSKSSDSSSDSSSSSSDSSRSRRSYSKRSRKHRHRRDDGAESSDRYRRKRTTSESSDSSSSSSDSSRSGHAYSKRSRKHRHKRDYRAESSDRYRRKSTTSESSDSSSSSRNSSRSRHAYGKRKRKYRNKRDYRAESSDRHGRKSHGRDRHHRDKKRKRRERDSSYSSDESNTRRDPLRSEKRTAGVGEGFRIDVKSDKNNLCFDSLHFTDTVIYRRVGHSCLGLNRRRQSVTWKEASKAKKKYKTESSTLRYFTPNFVDLQSENVEEGTVLADLSRADIPQERTQRTISYIPIDAPATNLPRPDFDPLGVYDPSTQAYLGSDPKPSHTNTAKPQHQSAPTSNSRSAFTKTTASYNRHLHDNPQDIPKWLEFIRFQDTAEFDTLISTSDGSGSNAKQSGRKRSAKMIAEKKLAILEKALLKNPDSVPLQLEQLEIGKEFWDMSQQTRQWEKLLKSNPDNIPLWREYLLFKQACFSAFSVSKVAGLYGRCFRKLVARQTELDGCEAVELENQLLDLFVSLCHFWRQAGHTEKAVAAYQAMIELNCFCPQQFQQDTHAQGQIAFLETFWDSAEPRFGEIGAKGWASWMQKRQRGGWAQIQEPQSDDRALEESSNPSMNSSDQPLWQAWMREEVFREQSHFAPWRPDEAKGETEEDCEDPERMVLFDDIGQALFRLSSQQNQFRLVLFFLDFLGVSVPGCLLECPGEVANTTGIYLEQPSQILPPVCKPTLTLGVAGNCRSLEQFASNVESTKRSPVRDSNTQNKALEDFVEEVFVRIIPVFPEQAQTKLLLMRLDFHMQKALMSTDDKRGQKKRLKDAKRFAKKLLSQEENRNNLDLWAALARWEHSLNNTDEAKRVLQTALIFLGQPKTETDRHAATRLVWTFADMFVQYDSTPASSVGAVNGSNTEVLHLLTTVAEGGVFTPLQEVPGQCVSATRILKARRNYQEMMTQALASYSKECDENTELSEWCRPSGSYIVHLAKCFAIFQYLTVGMQAASVVYESSLSALKRSGSRGSDFTSPRQVRVDQELLTTAHVRLFSAHAYSNPGPLGTLRNLIKTSLADYPSSPELLDAFIHSEAKSHIAGRVRRYFDQVTRRSNHPIQWLFAIRAELLRQEAVLAATTAAEVKDLLAQQTGVSLPESGISNRIRALFDRACESQHSRHCVLLWRMYMQFEVQQGNLKRAESIFYSALQHCPWAKVLYMDAVRYFPTKLQDCQDLLMEKELRIRAPLEEVELLIKT